jgi:hypothetical protein
LGPKSKLGSTNSSQLYLKLKSKLSKQRGGGLILRKKKLTELSAEEKKKGKNRKNLLPGGTTIKLLSRNTERSLLQLKFKGVCGTTVES